MYLSKPYLISREQYDNYLHTHISNVINAYEWMVEENILDGIFSADSIIAAAENCHAHDASKYDEPEYEAYRQYWNPMPNEVVGEKRGNPCGDRGKYNVGWLHHYHRNPHHWEFWNLLHEDDQGKVLSLEMPDKYVIEMLADWLSFSFTANDLSELGEWWDKKKSGIVLHSNVLTKVENVIQAINNKILSGYKLNESKLPKRLVDNQVSVLNKIAMSIEKDLKAGKISFKKAKARFEDEIEDLMNDVQVTSDHIDPDFEDQLELLSEIAQNTVNDWKVTYSESKEELVEVNSKSVSTSLISRIKNEFPDANVETDGNSIGTKPGKDSSRELTISVMINGDKYKFVPASMPAKSKVQYTYVRYDPEIHHNKTLYVRNPKDGYTGDYSDETFDVYLRNKFLVNGDINEILNSIKEVEGGDDVSANKTEGKIKDLDVKLSTYKELEDFLDGASPQDSDYISAVEEMKKIINEIPDFSGWYRDRYGKQPKKLESKSSKVSYSELVDIASKVSQGDEKSEAIQLEVRNYKNLDDKARSYIGRIRVRASKGSEDAQQLVADYEKIPSARQRGRQEAIKMWIQLAKEYLGE